MYIQLSLDSNLTNIFAKKALLNTGWADNVRLRISNSVITSIEIGCSVDKDDYSASIVIPGVTNAHSHAFQRALVGHTEKRESTDRDTFWSWRTQMYSLAGSIDAKALRIIARQTYSEMMTAGYTSVAEFHYLHKEKEGRSKKGAMLQAIMKAAADTGIRLTYIPVLYERASFDQPKPTSEQRQFVMTLDQFIDHYDYARETADSNTTIGIGAHSLRAVSKSSLSKLSDLAKRDECPMHIHIAEQTTEIDQCLTHYNARPIEWLLKEFSVNPHWCLVHATHISEKEMNSICESGTVICLCPSTEANLGDGLFPLKALLDKGGRFAIGSDSQITINPFEELRWLEYGQRLTSRSRNIAAVHNSHTGNSLFEKAIEGGSLACGKGTRNIQKGSHADLIVLDDDSPIIAGHNTESILDALIFSGINLPINRVMVAGKWCVINGAHINTSKIKNDFKTVVDNLWLTSKAPI